MEINAAREISALTYRHWRSTDRTERNGTGRDEEGKGREEERCSTETRKKRSRCSVGGCSSAEKGIRVGASRDEGSRPGGVEADAHRAPPVNVDYAHP